MFLAKVSGIITLHINPLQPISPKILRHYDEVFANFVVMLIDRGLDYIDTWIPVGDEKGQRFASHFGFMETGFIKYIQLGDIQYEMLEMRCPFGA